MKKDTNSKYMGKLGAISGVAGCMIAMLEKGDDGIPFPIWGGLGILIICLIAYIRDRKLLPIFFIGVSIFIMCIMGSIPAFIDVTPKTHTIWVIAGILQLLIILTIMVYIKGIVGRYKVEEAKKILSITVPTIIVLVVILILASIFL